jgi:hypothetical protein
VRCLHVQGNIVLTRIGFGLDNLDTCGTRFDLSYGTESGKQMVTAAEAARSIGLQEI